ncbi:MAG: GAF domain-containing protein [Candidatus Dadabacteria bacterium]|nr:MAG: GAF domain-containing protein [Candidatus Dadabacteria bacterium]
MLNKLGLKKDLCRLARFGANISDAHSCLIFLPSSLFKDSDDENREDFLELCGFHSLSNDVVKNCRLPHSGGLIGWVANHARSIHVSPFEQDSRVLGIYNQDQNLKSFIGIPVPLNFGSSRHLNLSGVIACDSCKSFAFSKLQVKLIEDLAREVSNTIKLTMLANRKDGQKQCWQTFLAQANGLINELGKNSVEILRISPQNLRKLESTLGTSQYVSYIEELLNLIKQALPAQFPYYTMPSGDLIIVLDNMMTRFYQNRIEAICEHRAEPGAQLKLSFSVSNFRAKRLRRASLEELILETLKPHLSQDGVIYEYRRA